MFKVSFTSLLLCILTPISGFADVSVTATEQDGYVEFVYSGTFDLDAADGHTQTFTIAPADTLSPTSGSLLSVPSDVRLFEVISPMGAFGTDPGSFSVSRQSGDGFGWSNVWVYFPQSWSEGETISGSIIAPGSYDSLGLTVGNYALTAWGGDISLSISEGAIPVPEPATYALLFGLAAVGMAAKRARSRNR